MIQYWLNNNQYWQNILLQYYVLEYNTGLYFPEHRLAVEVDEFDYIDRTGDNEREDKIKESQVWFH